MLRQQLVGTVGGEIPVPKTALDVINRFRNEQRTVDYVMLDRAQAGDIADPSPEVLAKYFEERKVLFRSPEFRKVLVLSLTPAEIAAAIEISDADLNKAYEERKARYAVAERRHLQQIVFPNMEEAKAGAEKIAKGTTFAALAAERGLKDSDMDLGTLTKSAMVDRAVADVAFELKQGEVSAPVEGRFGIVLVQADKIEPASVKPFDEVSAELKTELAAERSRSELLSLHDKVEDERLGGAPLADIVKKLDLKARTIEAMDRAGQDRDGKPVADLPQGVDLIGAVFRADQGSDNDPLNLPQQTGYVWYDVVEVIPARDRTLDDVKDQLLTRWRDDQIAARLKTKADEMLAKLKRGHAVRRSCGGFQFDAAMDARSQAWLPAARHVCPRARGDFRNTEGPGRHHRGADADGPHGVPRHRNHGAGAGGRIRRKRSGSTKRCAAPSPTTCWPSMSRGWKPTSA